MAAKKSRKRGKSESDSDDYNNEYEEVEHDYDDDGEEDDFNDDSGEEGDGQNVTDDEDDGTREHSEWKNDEMEQLEKEYRDLHHQELDTLKNLNHHKDKDLLKGQAVKSQKALWYKVLELRFLLQKPFSSSNRLPQEPIKSSFCEADEAVKVAYSDLVNSSKETLDSILELQEALSARNPSITQATVGLPGPPGLLKFPVVVFICSINQDFGFSILVGGPRVLSFLPLLLHDEREDTVDVGKGFH